jgi:hypothetical protein
LLVRAAISASVIRISISCWLDKTVIVRLDAPQRGTGVLIADRRDYSGADENGYDKSANTNRRFGSMILQ